MVRVLLVFDCLLKPIVELDRMLLAVGIRRERYEGSEPILGFDTIAIYCSVRPLIS